jgi:hydrogenase nickel incorporation protein HypB
MKIPVVKKILSANDQVAASNRTAFDTANVFVVNVMASPGAGKTSLILSTIEHLPDDIRPGVIEGDLASSIDADTIAERGIPVVQINTGGSCHLDASMLQSALPSFPLQDVNLLFIENVGNLVCPASFALGANLSVVVSSMTEGHDKPYKYPKMFSTVNGVVLNKADLSEVFQFDVDYFRRGVEMVNADVPFFVLSCRTGEGVREWTAWLVEQMRTLMQAEGAARSQERVVSHH